MLFYKSKHHSKIVIRRSDDRIAPSNFVASDATAVTVIEI